MSKANYHDDTECSRRLRTAQLQFIFEYETLLLIRRNGNKHLEAMRNIAAIPNKTYSSKQMNYIDSVYEMVMKQLGFPSYVGQKSKYGVNLRA